MGISKNINITEEDMINILDQCYAKVMNGIPNIDVGVEKMANDYLSKHETVEQAANAMIKNQVVKCTTSGFITGLGGVITLPVAIPANIASVIYVQMRMIACAAHMKGYDLRSDQVQTLVYACLAGVAVNGIVKNVAVGVGLKMGLALVKKVPGKVLIAINKKVGFRLVTKFGTKSILSLGKMIPVIGGVVGGGFDLLETKVIGHRAYQWFVEEQFDLSQA
ncbi:MAG: EcsC family protein [Erysipelotrichaceae bacterium]